MKKIASILALGFTAFALSSCCLICGDRPTIQASSGEPHSGLIPTMKVLAE